MLKRGARVRQKLTTDSSHWYKESEMSPIQAGQLYSDIYKRKMNITQRFIDEQLEKLTFHMYKDKIRYTRAECFSKLQIFAIRMLKQFPDNF